MITKKERQVFKQIADKSQAWPIAEKLNRAGCRTPRNKTYTNRLVTAVIRGDREDLTAELYILQHYDNLRKEKEALRRLKKDFN